MEKGSSDDLDINLESTVVLALSKLQKGSKTSKKRQNPTGVSCKKVVEFLKANYDWLDGDVESQVLTALLSCIKTGIVCALDNHKYLLIGSSAKKMISNCITRVSHGPKCCCLPMLNSLLKSHLPRNCCYIKNSDPSAKKQKKSPTRAKPKVAQSPRRKKKPTKPRKKMQKKCARTAQKQMGTSESSQSICNDLTTKCDYCLEIHSLPKVRKLCVTCYPIGKLNTMPTENFSPRDEVTPAVDKVANTVVENVVENNR